MLVNELDVKKKDRLRANFVCTFILFVLLWRAVFKTFTQRR